MIIFDAICVSMPYVAAFAIAYWAFQSPKRGVYLDSLLVVLGLGIGTGMGSCSFFLWRSLHHSTEGLKLGEVLFFFLCTAVFVVLMRHKLSQRIPNGLPAHDGTIVRPASALPCLGFFVVLMSALVGFVLLSYNRPHGSSDAYVIWNLHARFLSRGGADWKNYLSPLLLWTHPDYPLLVPATIARFWTYLGTETVLVPGLLGGFFTFATVALLIFSLSFLQLRNQGFLAAIFLLASSPFINLGAYQMADVPIGFFMLSTTIILTLKDYGALQNNRLTVLAGITCALAAWTKNEGLLFVLAVVISRITLYLTKRDIRHYFRETLFFSFGFIPIIAVLLFFKIKYSPPNDLMAAQTLSFAVPKLLDISRYVLVGRWFLREITHFGNGVTVVFFVYLVLAGVELDERKIQPLISTGVLLVTMLCGHFFIYIVSPFDLNWHLSSSSQRLLIQLWPTLLFLAFLITRPLFDRESEKGARFLST